MNKLRIRRLIPLEAWRLMGFNDEVFNKAAKVNSNTQLYKQAGNSICVPILENVIKNLFVDDISNSGITIDDYLKEVI